MLFGIRQSIESTSYELLPYEQHITFPSASSSSLTRNPGGHQHRSHYKLHDTTFDILQDEEERSHHRRNDDPFLIIAWE